LVDLVVSTKVYQSVISYVINDYNIELIEKNKE